MATEWFSKKLEMAMRIALGRRLRWWVWGMMFVVGANVFADEPTLESRLQSEPSAQLAKAARETGDAVRGAIVFHRVNIACSKCHAVDGSKNALGPELTALPAGTTDEHLVESILFPSKVIRQGFETVNVTTGDGRTLTGLLAASSPERIVLRDPSRPGQTITIARGDIEIQTTSKLSLMPTGQVNQLPDRQQFLDLVKYLIEIRNGGTSRARELQPPPALLAVQIPEYERVIDHAGIIADWDKKALERGEKIYRQVCLNCHGTPEQAGSLPTSLRFATGQFKSRRDPFGMYQTLTHGFGLMMPQTWMVPQQKYDVIHYIRETYLRPLNPSQLVAVTPEYLASLPKGNTRGPAPRVIEPWVTMDYGPVLASTYEINGTQNIAQKGMAIRLDPGAGGVSRGRQWLVFEHDTLRVAGAWTGTGFIDWNAIHFNGAHQSHPKVVGDVVLSNPTGPGWANPATGSFTDDARVVGRDGRRYGPLPKSWATYRGLYTAGDRAVVAYRVGETDILETPGAFEMADAKPALSAPVFTRDFQIGARPQELRLLVATSLHDAPQLQIVNGAAGLAAPSENSPANAARQLRFDGGGYLEVPGDDFEMTQRDFTITARIRTTTGGTVVATTTPGERWVPNGKTLFVARGRLVFDIGWVGQFESKRRVADGEWHDVALRWSHARGEGEFFVDGKSAGGGTLKPKASLAGQVLRIGFTSPDFPRPQSHFDGDLQDVRFFSRAVSNAELAELANAKSGLVAHWKLDSLSADGKAMHSGSAKHAARWIAGDAPAKRASPILAGLSRPVAGAEFYADGARLCLKIPAGSEPLELGVWTTRAAADPDVVAQIAPTAAARALPDWKLLTNGGAPHWPQTLTTEVTLAPADGPFAVDVLTHPASNPWLAQMRFTGLDFFPDGDRMVVTAWDGDIWLVSGLAQLNARSTNETPAKAKLTWRRIAAGLFQPLGVKWVNGEIFVTCRDQLAILRDRNGDGEVDFVECFNNDHQVTEHFHEFAMGLQTDAAGNFYYAKSARHALKAVVPHHGTLLRVSKDGSRTDIVATGFRAANGVCLNPDGSFVVTDQEGHWNPKNRINWVSPGGFYGNMFGYHDVTDASDSAMQPPLCWITNSFDRSPAELLWTPADAWGPLGNSLLNLSYGYGKIFVVPWEDVNGVKQGGMCSLPVPALPTGVMRGRFHPQDKQLYACGMFAWAGSATQPGGLYRIRYTVQPAHLPTGLHAQQGKLRLTFSEPIDRASATEPANYAIKTWSLKRTANYGSQHHDEKKLQVAAAELSADGRSVTLTIPQLEPTWCMEIVCRLRGANGESFERVIHNTIHNLSP